ncbi:MAG: hypothetical protein PHT33_03775 [bacterium]|nr:hypothetical protein [bacterium]
MELRYPEKQAQKVITLEAAGGEPSRLSLTVPTVVSPGETFTLRIAITDEHGLPVIDYRESISVCAPFCRTAPGSIAFRENEPAIAILDGLVTDSEGFFRCSARFAGKVFYSNPVRCTGLPVRRIYWGDPHIHTVLSDCHPERCRSLDFCYTAARYLTGLDWCAATDHVSNGRCDYSRWKAQRLAGELYNDPPEFVTLPAYEASFKGGAGGDNNVYFNHYPDMFLDDFEDGNVGTLCAALAERSVEGNFFVVPHHTTRSGKHGEIRDAIYPGAAQMPVMEIHSKWGTSEYRNNPNALKQVHKGPCYAVDFLNRGLKLGFIAGTDTHSTITMAQGEMEPAHIDRLPGLTAVRAESLTRESLFSNIRNRNCYAASLERIYLDFSCSGMHPGQCGEIESSAMARRISVTAAAQSDILTVEIIRNGEVIHKHAAGGWHEEVSFTDEGCPEEICLSSRHLGRFIYYYVRLTCQSGAQAWSSPVWFVLK